MPFTPIDPYHFQAYQEPDTQPASDTEDVNTSGNQLVAGVKTGIDGLQATAYGAAALFGDAIDSKSLFDFGMNGYKRNIKESKNDGLRVADFGQIHNTSDAFDYALGGIGQMAPSALMMIGTGGVGGLVAKKGIELAAKKAIKERIKKGVIKEADAPKVLRRIMKSKATLKTIQRGQLIGTAAGSMGSSTGGVYGDVAEKGHTGAGAIAGSIATGAASGALDILPFLGVAKKFGFGGELSAEAAKKIASYSAKKRIGLGTLETAATEGATEAAQTGIEEVGKSGITGEALPSDLGHQMINSGLLGAIGGGAMGGVAAIPTPHDPSAVSTQPEQAPQTQDNSGDLSAFANEISLEDTPQAPSQPQQEQTPQQTVGRDMAVDATDHAALDTVDAAMSRGAAKRVSINGALGNVAQPEIGTMSKADVEKDHIAQLEEQFKAQQSQQAMHALPANHPYLDDTIAKEDVQVLAEAGNAEAQNALMIRRQLEASDEANKRTLSSNDFGAAEVKLVQPEVTRLKSGGIAIKNATEETKDTLRKNKVKFVINKKTLSIRVMSNKVNDALDALGISPAAVVDGVAAQEKSDAFVKNQIIGLAQIAQSEQPRPPKALNAPVVVGQVVSPDSISKDFTEADKASADAKHGKRDKLGLNEVWGTKSGNAFTDAEVVETVKPDAKVKKAAVEPDYIKHATAHANTIDKQLEEANSMNGYTFYEDDVIPTTAITYEDMVKEGKAYEETFNNSTKKRAQNDGRHGKTSGGQNGEGNNTQGRNDLQGQEGQQAEPRVTPKREYQDMPDDTLNKMAESGVKVAIDEVKARQGEKAAKGKTDVQSIKNSYSQDDHKTLFKRVFNGDAVSADDFKKSFDMIIKHKDKIITELNSMTKKAILERNGGMFAERNRNEKKADVVESAYHDMLTDFTLGQSFSYTFGEDSNAGIKRVVDETTDASLNKFAEDRKGVIEERAKRSAERKADMKEPQTVEDYHNILRQKKVVDGMTYAEARLSLTLAQREAYDSLTAEESRTERSKRKASQQEATFSDGDSYESTDIIQTKNTKLGHDLWQFQLVDRIDRAVFKSLVTQAKQLGGNYSSYRGNGAIPGWQFRTEEAAQAFKGLISGKSGSAKDVMKKRRDAYADDKSQSATERLEEMADSLESRATDKLNQDRKTNTSRRASMTARAESDAESDISLAKTMRNIATSIRDGNAKFLDRVRQKVQVEELRGYVNLAHGRLIRDKYDSYNEQENHKHDPVTIEAADYTDYPSYTMYRSDLATLARKMMETAGSKQDGAKLLKVADDVSKEYIKFARENMHKVSRYARADGTNAVFTSKPMADKSLQSSGFKGKAIVLPFKRGQNIIIMSPSEAIKEGIWEGDNDKRITLREGFGDDIVSKLGKDAPWQFKHVSEQLRRLKGMGIETPAEHRAALREFINLSVPQKQADKVKVKEREMVGRKKDGLDFFPTPESVADEMVSTADIQEGMRVLEPSAGWGHIADKIKEAGVTPDVIELSGERRELLELKGYDPVASDFMEFNKGGYDRIIMNPPFSDRRDMEHIQHAYDLLKPGGRLVAITGEGVFFGKDKKAVAFREWLEEVGATDEKMVDGTFKDSNLPVNTGANARMVVIDKPKGTALYSKNRTTTGQTVAETEQGLINQFGARMKRAIEKGKVVIHRTAVNAPEGVDSITNSNDQIQGWYSPDGTINIVAENNDADSLAGVVLHEAKHRFDDSTKGQAILSKSIKQIETAKGMARSGRGKVAAWIAEAETAIPSDTPAKDYYHELFAYAVQQYHANRAALPNTIKNIVKRYVDALAGFIRAHLLKAGIPVKVTPAALASLARSELNSMGKREGVFSGETAYASIAKEYGISVEEAKQQYEAVVDKYKGTPQWMKAPNGKPSKLNERQWVQTRTPAFKAWFGEWEIDTDVVDKAHAFIRASLKGKTERPITLWQVDDAMAKQITNIIGEDVQGFRFELNSSDLRHAMNGHGNEAIEGGRKQEAIAESDLLAIPYILKSPDYIRKGSSKGKRPSVIFGKRVNGTIEFVEVVLDKGVLSNKTMWKKKRSQRHQVTFDPARGSDPSLYRSIEDFLEKSKPSKVVDENGEPMVVYHGSVDGKSFNTFKEENIWFASKKNVARDQYSTINSNGDLKESSKTFEAFLDIKAPFKKDIKGELFDNIDVDIDGENFDVAEDLMDEISSNHGELYDGGILFNIDEEQMFGAFGGKAIVDDYIAFNPNQIKSATGNTGQFNTNNTDIRYSKAATREYAPALQAVKEKLHKPRSEASVEAKIKEQYGIFKDRWYQGTIDQFSAINKNLNDPRSWMMAHITKSAPSVLKGVIDHGAPEMFQNAVRMKKGSKSLKKIFAPLLEETNDFLQWIAVNRMKIINEKADAAGVQANVLQERNNVLKRDIKAIERDIIESDISSDRKQLRSLMAANKEEVHSNTIEIKRLKETLSRRDRTLTDKEINIMLDINKGQMADGKSREAVYEQVRKDFEALHGAIVNMAATNHLISKEEAARWIEEGFYVPFYRALDDVGGVLRGASVTDKLVGQTAYKIRKGSDKPLNDLLSNVLGNWNHLISASLNNQASLSALKTASSMDAATKVKEENKDKDAVFVRANGKKVWFDVHDPLVLEALTALDYNGLNNGFMKTMRWFKRALTIGVTASPEFKVRNMFRDTIQAMAVANMRKNPFSNVAQGWKAMREDSTTGIDMLFGGGAFGQSGYIHGTDPDAVKQLVKINKAGGLITEPQHFMKHLWEAYQDFGGRLENVNRAANFEQAMAEGRDLLTSNFEARDHLDFSRTGSWVAVRAMTQVIPFLNARMQGLDKVIRAGTSKQQQAQFLTVVGVYTTLSVMLYALMAGDDDYKDAEDWEKDTYHLFKLSRLGLPAINDADGKEIMFKIPRPFEVGAIANLAERITQQGFDDEATGKDFGKALWFTATQTLGIDPRPQIFKPAMEVYANKNSFTGRAIESMGMKFQPTTERSKPWTSDTAIAASKTMGAVLPDAITLSPVQIQHLVRGYFGYIGTVTLGAADMLVTRNLNGAAERPDWRMSEYPLVKAFVDQTPLRHTKYATEVYDALNEANQVFNTISRYRKGGNFKEASVMQKDNKTALRNRHMLNTETRRVSQLNKKAELIFKDKVLTGAQKTRKLDEINRLKNTIFKRAAARLRTA